MNPQKLLTLTIGLGLLFGAQPTGKPVGVQLVKEWSEPAGSLYREYRTVPLASGTRKDFSPFYEITSGSPPDNYKLATAWFRTEGDRSCSGTESSAPGIYGKPEGVGSWAQCYEVKRNTDQVTWAVALQGHDEAGVTGVYLGTEWPPVRVERGAGVGLTTGILTVRYVPNKH